MNLFHDKNVVVTGGSGMIGTHMITKLLGLGANVKTHVNKSPIRVEDGRITILHGVDLTKLDDAVRLIEGSDYVIHLAGMIANPKSVPTDFQVALNQITCFTNVLEASRLCNVEKFIDLNSGTGYPLRDRPLHEDEYWDDEPYISYYGYGWMRRYREKVMEHCSHISDIHLGLCRTTAVYGPYDNFDLETCHVIPALIKRVLSDENPFEVWGSPSVIRDFIYVKDVVDGMLLVMERGKSMRPYNLGSGVSLTIGDIVDNILKVTNKSPKVVYDESKPTTIPIKLADVNRIQSELGYQTNYSIYEGLKETIEWYIKSK